MLIGNPDGSTSLPRVFYGKDYCEGWTHEHWRVGTLAARLAGELGGSWSIVAAGQITRLKIDALSALPFDIAPNGDTGILAQSERSRVGDDAVRVAVTKSFDVGANVHNKLAVIASYLSDRLNGYFINTSPTMPATSTAQGSNDCPEPASPAVSARAASNNASGAAT